MKPMEEDLSAGLVVTGQKTLAPPKRKKKAPRKETRFKLTRFDKDLFTLVKGGTVNVDDILTKTGLDSDNFHKRLKTLVAKGFFIHNTEKREIRLGWKGYNILAPKLVEEKPLEPVQEKPPVSSLPPIIQQAPPQIEEKKFEKEVVIEVKNTVDLADLLEKGSPKNKPPSKQREYKEYRAPPAVQETKPAPQQETQPTQHDKGKPLELDGKEACELCKAKFKLNVKNTDESKFGHCFCGASFHKDCYESILERDGKCVRCGRKLAQVFDRKTEDAVKGIKNVFD